MIASEIKSHPFYPIFKKTLCAPSERTSSIDELIHDMELKHEHEHNHEHRHKHKVKA